MSVTGAITRLNTIALGLAGVRSAPDVISEEYNAYPFALTYVVSVDATRLSSALLTTLWTLRVEFHMPAQDWGRGLQTLTTLLSGFMTAIMADTSLGGQVDTAANNITGRIAPAQWGGTQTIAAVIDAQYKIIST